MNNSIHRISLDVHDTGSQVSISAKKGDTARSLHITLTENGKPYRIAEGCHAVFTGVKSDKNYLFNDCTIKDNVIIYDFTEQTVPVVGQVHCEIILYDANNERITSPRFDIVVDDVVYNDEEIVSSDEAKALISATAEAKAITAEVEQKLANGDFVGGKGEKGDKGDTGSQGISGVYVGSGDMPEGYNVQVDPNGEPSMLEELIRAIATQVNKISTVTLPANQWQGTTSPYSQVVNIAGATENSKIDLNPTIEQLNIFHEKDITFVVANSGGVITVYCIGQKPANDYTIQVSITEVMRYE